MNLKQKVKTYSFWISLISAVLIVVRIIGEHFGWFINESLIMDIVTGVCGILVLLGILSSPTNKEEPMEETINNLQEQSKQAIAEQKELTKTIQQDITEKQLSLEEQIALLKQNAQNKQQESVGNIIETKQATLTNESNNLGQVSEQIVDANKNSEQHAETQDYGIVYVPETEIVAPVVREEFTAEALQTEAEEPLVQEVLLGVEPTQQPEAFVQANMQAEATVEQVVQQTLETGVAEQLANVEPLSQDNTIFTETTQQTTTTNFSELSTDELKELLFELLQRL